MTRKMKLTALTLATLAGALVATTALADRGMGMGGGMGMEQGMGPQGGPMAGLDFAAIDTDKDGKITAAELTAWRAAEAKALDADGDGLISADELAKMQMKGMENRAQTRAAAMVSRLDSDGDGKLSATEMAARPVPTGLIDRLDTDKDGALSQAELDAAKTRMAEGMGQRMKMGRGHGGERNGDHGRGGHGFWGFGSGQNSN